jgi:hypothetical protein
MNILLAKLAVSTISGSPPVAFSSSSRIGTGPYFALRVAASAFFHSSNFAGSITDRKTKFCISPIERVRLSDSSW